MKLENLKQIKLRIRITRTLLLVFLIGSTLGGYSQNVVAQRKPAYEQLIPKVVVSKFKKQYPDVLLKGWYLTHLVYWQNDYSSDWYYGWYGQREVIVYNFQKPNYYEVEFMNYPGELSRAIYNIHGYWYETRTKIHGLTIGILDALKESEYKDWEISKTKEKLESPAWPVEIYRFQVSKGRKSQIIRMDEKGNLIQIKEIVDSSKL